MLEILSWILILIGVVLLIKGNIKISDTKTINRPHSVYFSIVILGYGFILMFLDPIKGLLSGLVFFGSLILLAVFCLNKGEKNSSSQSLVQHSDSKRNMIIFIVFAIIIGLVWYFWGNAKL